ncbi:alpha/beta hydrolase family esterase [Nocardia sp. CA-107356]|uniref:alpha/beta hydrolase family esterase n=1 Tax=Nocardia sp. CA-107356 TaxID=3239972 RepID=UPI003D8B0A70
MFWLRSVAVAVACCALSATACQSPAAPPTSPSPPAAPTQDDKPGSGDQRIIMEFGGKTRSYVVHAPPSYDGSTALPLVVALHFYPGDAARIATTSGLNAKADKENFLVVYPEGHASGFNAFLCCGSEDDVGFVKTVLARMISAWKADPKRVYAAGISNGGDMSFKLAVELPGTFAAIAAVSGGFIGSAAAQPSYKPTTPVSVITFLGGKDRYFGRFDTGITQWQERLACAPGVARDDLANGITVATATCADGSTVEIYRLPEMGHSWPGAAQGELSDAWAGVNATDLAWDFFEAHAIQGR